MALFGRNGVTQAQSSDAANPTRGELQEVVVTGIRASLQQSL